MDISERKRVQDALTETECFRTLADSIAQLAWMADETGWIFWYNLRWFEYTGTTLEEMQGWGWQQIHHPEHVDRVVQKIRHCFETGEVWEDTFPLRGRNGMYRWFLSRAIPIHDDSGKVVRWFGTNTDVTDQHQSEEALRDADRRKDEFLALLGHELRNPLTPILTAAQLLNIKGPHDPQLQKARDTIVRQTMQLSKLVDDLLDVGRITAGKLRLQKEPVELKSLLAQAIETCRSEIEKRRHRLDVSLPLQPVYLDADGTRIVQIVCNLLNNAAKYMPEGGAIQLTAEVDAGTAVICVRDKGIGIGADVLARVFEPFVQVGVGPRHAQGLGIGLALVKSLVEMHGGTVEARSDGLDRGSEFIVRLRASEITAQASGG